jgi:hypothetical protein
MEGPGSGNQGTLFIFQAFWMGGKTAGFSGQISESDRILKKYSDSIIIYILLKKVSKKLTGKEL